MMDSPPPNTISGPWRATRLWNDIIRTMRTGLPVKKQKKNMKTYENCIGSVEIIDWLHKSLQRNVNFGTDVTREQTVQLLKKLYRAGILENVRGDDSGGEFKETGELYRLSNRSPVKVLRTPGKGDRKVLGDVGNTPMKNSVEEKAVKEENKRKRDKSSTRKQEAKKQLNLNYFQSLPSNSLIILDNEGTWKKVYCEQLSNVLSSHHVQLLDNNRLLNMENVMHNMTRVSTKGIVQLEEKGDDLPHWVLSAMKCLANWPRQLRTLNGKESCLPSYPGFEHDVFNVVKDYFLGLPEPLSTFALFDYFMDAWVKAEAMSVAKSIPRPCSPQQQNCNQHPGSAARPCSRPFAVTDMDANAQMPASQFYTMSEAGSHDFVELSHQERVAKIRQTFSMLPPLATSSVKGSATNSSNLTSSSISTMQSSTSLSPDMSTTAIMRNFLPPNTCFETVFMESSPVTRIVPQAQNEVLHFSRSGSGRSLSHIASGISTKSSATQTESGKSSDSLKRLPKWRRSSRLRKSVAVMENPDNMGMVNRGFSSSPKENGEVRAVIKKHGKYSISDLPNSTDYKEVISSPMRHTHSLDNLLDREADRRDFLLKYRQVSGDLRSGHDLVQQARSGRDSSVIMSKTVRKEKRKSRARETTSDSSLTPALQRMRLESEDPPFCYDNPGMEDSPKAPLASQEECDLSPVVPAFRSRNHQYNSSYRLATLHPSPPRGLPRTSTKLSLAKPLPPPKRIGPRSVAPQQQEPMYTVAGPGPLRRYPAPDQFNRGSQARSSVHSQMTVDSGRYSLPPCPTYQELQLPHNQPQPAALGIFKLLTLLIPPANRRRLQLLLKFILKISMNSELVLDSSRSNAVLALETFLEVVLRPKDVAVFYRDLALPILQFFLDNYDAVWTPPQNLRREVEEAVYRSLVNKRIAAGEDPYPVTYCKQVTKDQYASQSHYGSQSALQDLLGAIIADTKMTEKQKRKKLIKFKEAYPEMWRKRFPLEDMEPEFMTRKERSGTTISTLNRLRSAIRM